MKLICILAALLSFVTPAKTIPGISGKDLTFYELYNTYKSTDPEKACTHAETFLSTVDTTCFHPEIVSMEEYLAEYYESKAFLFSKAIKCRERTLRRYIRNGDREGAAKTTYSLARLYYDKGIYHKSLQYANMAKDWYESTGDLDKCLNCYNLLGILYRICKDNNKSSEYLDKYISGARQLKDSTKLAKALNNLSVTSNFERDTIRSLGMLRRAISLTRARKDSSLLSSIYLNFAFIYLKHDNYIYASRYLDTAANFITRPDEFGKLFFLKSIFFLWENNREQAISCLYRAISYYSMGEFELKEQECLQLLHNILYKSGDYKEAYISLREYHQIAQSKASSDMYLELFRAENKIRLAEEHETMADRQMLQAILFSSGIVLLLIILFIISHILRNKSFQIRQNEAELTNQKLITQAKEQEIRSKNEILEIKQMEQFRIDRLSNEIIQRLDALCKESKEEKTRQHVRSIIREISNMTDKEHWKEITNYIPEFNSDFSKNLQKVHPDLSINERRLCTLLNLNMTTKEISDITRQSTAGINKARTRLRNKLGLTGNDLSIQEYLSRFNNPQE